MTTYFPEGSYLEAAAESDRLYPDEPLVLRACACGRTIEDGNWALCVRCHEAGGPDRHAPPREAEPSGAVIVFMACAAIAGLMAVVGWGVTVWISGGLP